MWETIQPYVISAAVIIVTALIGYFAAWLKQKIGKISLKAIEPLKEKLIDEVDKLASKAVDVVNQTFVDDLKKLDKNGQSGGWKAALNENRDKALTMGVKSVKSMLAQPYTKGLTKLYGKENVDGLIANSIEAVLKQKPNNQK